MALSTEWAAKRHMERPHAVLKAVKVQNCSTKTNGQSADLSVPRRVIVPHGPAGVCIAPFLSADNLPYRNLGQQHPPEAGRSVGEAIKSHRPPADLSLPNVQVVPDI